MMQLPRFRYSAVALFVVLFVSTFVLAQVKSIAPSATEIGEENCSAERIAEHINAEKKKCANVIQKVLAQTAPSASAELSMAYERAQIEQYEHAIKLMNHTSDVFAWQSTAANVVLGLVVVMVLAGLSFSALQLHKAMQMNVPQSTTELEISASKIRVTSSVIGIVVLCLSFAFLYVFLHEVFTIKPISLNDSRAVAIKDLQ